MRTTILSLLLAAALAQEPAGDTVPVTTNETDVEPTDPAVEPETAEPDEPTVPVTEPTTPEVEEGVEEDAPTEPAEETPTDPPEPAPEVLMQWNRDAEDPMDQGHWKVNGAEVEKILPVRDDQLYILKDFESQIEGCKDPKHAEHAECYCRLQADEGSRLYTDTGLPHPKPYSAPFFGTNFCHTLSIDSPTCCNKLQDNDVKELWLSGIPQDCFSLTDESKEYAWLLKDLSCQT